ncbi:hypothetical protein Aduo_017454 [Ancylostoma duodenale]
MIPTVGILVVLAMIADSTLMESTTTQSNIFEISEDGVTLYYAHTMNETIYHILRSSNVKPSTDVVEVILNTMSKNLDASTVAKILKSLDGELDPTQRSNYVNVAIPRIIGLHKKMNAFIYKLAEIYGFTGDGIKIYAKLIRPMQLSSIISAALDGARNDNNTEQYNRVLALAKEIANMDDYQNKTIARLSQHTMKHR